MTKFTIMALLATSSFAGLSRNVGSPTRHLKRGGRSGDESSNRSYSKSYYEGYGEDSYDYDTTYCYYGYSYGGYDYYYGTNDGEV